MHAITSGIVLQSTSSQKNDLKILLFSPRGVLTVFAKNGQSLNCEYREALQPLAFGIYSIYTSYKSQIYHLQSAELRSFFPELRNSLEQLQAAGKMIRNILQTQWKEKPSTQLFSLLFNFLYRLPSSKNPEFFASMFSLKLLQHEGSFDLSPHCAQCKEHLGTQMYRYAGRKFCEQHAPRSAILIQENEEKIIQSIIQAKQFHELLQLSQFPISLEKKIDAIFASTLMHNRY